jgi:hypothetical protein
MDKTACKGEDMAFCTKCGDQNPDTALFCVKCGNPMGVVAQATSRPVSTGSPNPFIGEMIKSLSPGSLTICIGAIFAVFCSLILVVTSNINFLSWLFSTAYSAAAIGLVYFAHINGIKEKLYCSAATIAIGMIYAPRIFNLIAGSSAYAAYGVSGAAGGSLVGLSLLYIAFIAIVVGGFLNIGSVTKDIEI